MNMDKDMLMDTNMDMDIDIDMDLDMVVDMNMDMDTYVDIDIFVVFLSHAGTGKWFQIEKRKMFSYTATRILT